MIDTVALREKVLDLAIRGKLVPQDPNDEPASVLLERIRAQKQQMVKEGKLKAKDIKDDSIIFVGEDNLHYEKFADGTVKCIEDEIPFELPEGWAWCRLPFVGISELGKTLNGTKDVGIKVPYLCSINIYWDEIKLDKVKTTFFSNLETEKYQLKKGDLLICEGGESGRCFVWDADEKMYYQNALHRVRFFDKINPWFFKYVLESYHFTGILDDFCSGVTIKHLVKSALCSILFPLPPVNEQNRIISSINNLLNLISDINSNKIDLEICVENIKSKILDLAVRGKLVPQDPNDEPAFVLLERIRAEKEELIKQGKIKRDKKESIIFKGEDNSYYEKFDNGEVKCIDEDVPFELPDSWCWCRLGTLFAHNTGKALNSSDTAGTLMTYITTSNLYWDRFELDSLKEMPFTESKIEKCTVKTGDLLVCEGGDIGRSAIWMFDNDIRIQNHIHRLRPYVSLSNRFYYYVLYMWKQIGLIGGQGIGLQGFSSKALHNLIVPLPPLSEQMQIVSFVDELNQILSDIEKSLN